MGHFSVVYQINAVIQKNMINWHKYCIMLTYNNVQVSNCEWYYIINFFFLYRCRKSYNKRSSQWSCVEMKVDKTYPYIRELQHKILMRQLSDKNPVQREHPKAADDPRRLSTTCTKVKPPPLPELVAKKVSRFSTLRPNDEAWSLCTVLWLPDTCHGFSILRNLE